MVAKLFPAAKENEALHAQETEEARRCTESNGGSGRFFQNLAEESGTEN
jgi:hypothetical protein